MSVYLYLIGGLCLAAGVILGLFGHSIAMARRAVALDAREADLESREMRIFMNAAPAGQPARRGEVVHRAVAGRDRFDAPIVVDETATLAKVPDQPPAAPHAPRPRAYGFVSGAYPAVREAVQALHQPLPDVPVLFGQAEDIQGLVGALRVVPGAFVDPALVLAPTGRASAWRKARSAHAGRGQASTPAAYVGRHARLN